MGSVGPHQIRRAAASGGSLEERGRLAVAKLDEGGQQPRFYRMDVCGRHDAGSARLVRDCPPLSQLLGTPLRVAADALARLFASPGTPLL
jgi:hypothetical protein